MEKNNTINLYQLASDYINNSDFVITNNENRLDKNFILFDRAYDHENIMKYKFYVDGNDINTFIYQSNSYGNIAFTTYNEKRERKIFNVPKTLLPIISQSKELPVDIKFISIVFDEEPPIRINVIYKKVLLSKDYLFYDNWNWFIKVEKSICRFEYGFSYEYEIRIGSLIEKITKEQFDTLFNRLIELKKQRENDDLMRKYNKRVEHIKTFSSSAQ